MLKNTGETAWIGSGGYGRNQAAVADLNLDGSPEIIAGNTAYTMNGEIFWSNDLVQDGFSAVANFDSDPYPEVVVVGGCTIFLLEHSGEIIRSTTFSGWAYYHGGPPTIADFDGDHEPEIGIASPSEYIVFEANGDIKWTRSIQDMSSGYTGSTVFDFEGDGYVEIIQADELDLRIFRGIDGTVLWKVASGSGTLIEYPVVADVDHDHNAEMIVASNNWYIGTKNGIQVYGDANDTWVNTRKIWNQHTYHFTNVNDDGTIPQFEANSWEVYNTYRCNHSPDALACEDYSASYIRVDTANYPASVDILARTGNSGVLVSAEPLNVAFYHGDPAAGGTLLGMTVVESNLPSGAYEDVSITWDNPPEGLHELYVVVDDDGTGQGNIRESDEANNVAFSALFAGELPVADAGQNRTVKSGHEVLLDGSGSYDPDDRSLTYAWSFLTRPAGSTVALDDATLVQPGFTPDAAGEYILQLLVNNGVIDSGVDTVIITVFDTILPVVAITAPQEGDVFEEGDSISITAEASDEDGFVTRVEFYAGSALLGEDTTAPYTFVWPDVSPGNYALTATAYDNEGAHTASAPVAIIVNPMPNYPPAITSTPVYAATIDELYTYDVEASDPNDDVLTYSLTVFPEGMTIDAATGLITWTPTAAQTGQHTVTVIVEDGQGGGASQTYTMYVPDASNTAPQITSTPEFSGRVDELYTYDVDAGDAENDPLSYRFLDAPPAGMSLNASTGEIAWMPGEADVGTHLITVAADDGRNGIGGQSYSLTIRPPNVPPEVRITSPSDGYKVEEGSSLLLLTDASDSDGTISNVEFYVDGSLQGNDDSAPYTLTWNAAGIGEHTLYAAASDNDGATTTGETITITVTEPLPDTTAPVVDVTVTPQPVTLDGEVAIMVTIMDESPITDMVFEMTLPDNSTTTLPLVDNQAAYIAAQAGFYTATVTVTDEAGNTGTGIAVFSASDGSDTTPPVAELDDAECVEIKKSVPSSITGTVSDAESVLYTLQYREKGGTVWGTIYAGIVTSLTGELGVFDPTVHKNGLYEIRLTAEDPSGNVTVAEGCILLDSQLSFCDLLPGIDLNLPTKGLSLELERYYDSCEIEPGPFGPGWVIPGTDAQVTATETPGIGWDQQVQSGGFGINTYILVETYRHIMVLRLGDGLYKFEMVVEPGARNWWPIQNNETWTMTVAYNPVDGTRASLEALDVSPEVILLENELVTPGSYATYDPKRFRLTTEDETVYIVSMEHGVERVTDKYGNALTYSDTEIRHSSGAVISIERGAGNRIRKVTDSLGREIEYRYNDDGMLEQVLVKESPKSNVFKLAEQFAYARDTEGALGALDMPRLTAVYATDGTYLGSYEYDSAGRKIGFVDKDGNRIIHGYDTLKHEHTDHLGNKMVYTFDEWGNPLTETKTTSDGKTYSWSHAYDAHNNETLTVNPDNTKIRYDYVYDGDRMRTVTMTDELDNLTFVEFNDKEEPVKWIDTLGNITDILETVSGTSRTVTTLLNGVVQSVERYDNGSLVEETNAEGETRSYVYTPEGFTQSMTDARGKTTTFGPDQWGNVQWEEDPRGNRTEHDYDDWGNKTFTKNANNDTMTWEYAGDKETGHTSLRGYTTRYEYEGEHLSKTILPDQSEISYNLDDLGRPETITRTGKTISYTYNSNGDVEVKKVGETIVAQYEYNHWRGLKTAEIDANSNRTEYTYDEAGRLKTVKDADNNVTEYFYNAIGRRVKMLDALGRIWEYDYNEWGKMTHMYGPGGKAHGILLEHRVYDKVGRLLSTTDAEQKTTTYLYDDGGNLENVTDAMGNVTIYMYDNNSNRTEIRHNGHTIRKMFYDKLNRMIREEYADGRSRTIEYDEHGNIVKTIDADNVTITRDYDNMDRQTGRQGPGGVTTITYTNGRVETVTDQHGITRYTYDEQHPNTLVKRIDYPDGRWVEYDYDLNGNRTHIMMEHGTTEYRYDSLNRLTRVISGTNGTTTYAYDEIGRRTTLTHGNGVTVYYDYHPHLDALTYEEIRDPSGTLIARYEYEVNNAGKRTKVTELDGSTVSYGYDDLWRLIREERVDAGNPANSYVIEYVYDGSGNRLAKTKNGVVTTYTTNNRGQIVAEAGSGHHINYTYDDEGHLTWKQDTMTGTFSYTWRDGQFLEQVSGPAGTVSYDYDFQGNRIADTINGQTIKYHVDMTFDYAQVLAEYDSSGNVLASYTFGLERLSMFRNGQTYYYITDGSGSVRYLLDELGGLVGRYTYDAFGNVIDMQVNVENRFLFRGEFQDSLTGDYYLRARWFTPSNGQFTSMDPDSGDMFLPQTLHKYLYCGGDPVNRVDPSGESFISLLATTLDTMNRFLQQAKPIYNKYKKYKWAKRALNIVIVGLNITYMFLAPPEENGGGIIWKTKGNWKWTKSWPDIYVLVGGGYRNNIWKVLKSGSIKFRLKKDGPLYGEVTLGPKGFSIGGGLYVDLMKTDKLVFLQFKLFMLLGITGTTTWDAIGRLIDAGQMPGKKDVKVDFTLTFLVAFTPRNPFLRKPKLMGGGVWFKAPPWDIILAIQYWLDLKQI